MSFKLKIKASREIGKSTPSIGPNNIKAWEKLETLSDIFEDKFFSVSALNTRHSPDIDESIMMQIDRCDEVIASAEEGISIGLEMIEIAEAIIKRCDDQTLIHTLREQIKAIDLDIGILMNTADIQATSLKGFKAVAREIGGAVSAIQAQIDELLDRAPTDTDEAN